MTVRIYTLWAMMDGTSEGAWMIAAEDEFCWEGDPDRCERVFADARARNHGCEFREIEVVIDHDLVDAHFRPAEIEGQTT